MAGGEKDWGDGGGEKDWGDGGGFRDAQSVPYPGIVNDDAEKELPGDWYDTRFDHAPISSLLEGPFSKSEEVWRGSRGAQFAVDSKEGNRWGDVSLGNFPKKSEPSKVKKEPIVDLLEYTRGSRMPEYRDPSYKVRVLDEGNGTTWGLRRDELLESTDPRFVGTATGTELLEKVSCLDDAEDWDTMYAFVDSAVKAFNAGSDQLTGLDEDIRNHRYHLPATSDVLAEMVHGRAAVHESIGTDSGFSGALDALLLILRFKGEVVPVAGGSMATKEQHDERKKSLADRILGYWIGIQSDPKRQETFLGALGLLRPTANEDQKGFEERVAELYLTAVRER